jgi:hypothetical protein
MGSIIYKREAIAASCSIDYGRERQRFIAGAEWWRKEVREESGRRDRV